jgi:negative elongation factor C/D
MSEEEGTSHLTPVSSPTRGNLPSVSSPSLVETTPEQTRERCLALLQMPDAIMEPQIPKVVKDFIASGGQPPLVVKHLSESYRGHAQMCNLMCHWLKLSGVDDPTVNKMVEDQLKSIIMEKFDPKKADTIFTEGASAPQWLEFMITEPEWRSLIYQLSEAHTNCLMLNFAIQRISDLGHQGEIASLTTASTYFGVFNRVLLDTLSHICTLDQMSLPNALNDLKKMCCHSQHTYLYAQALLHKLMSSPNGHHLKRLSEELAACVSDKGPVVRRLQFMLSDASSYPVVQQSLSAMLATSSTNPSDIIKVYTEYSKQDPPPVELLRHPDVFDLLIRDLFNPTKNINPQHKSKYFYVLAYAASVREIGVGENRVVDRSLLSSTIEALEAVQPICQRNSFGSELQAAIPLLKSNLAHPVVSMGLLHWIRSNFTDPSYYTTSYNTLCTPLHLDLLREICARHPLQRPTVLDILVKSFEMEPELDALAALDLKRNLLDNIIFIMSCGYVLPVMDTIEHWTPKIDQSLIRYFVVKVLEMVEPPFSYAFVQSLLRIVGSSGTTEALKSGDSRDIVAQFIEHCSATDYGWSESEKSVLAHLAEVFAS